MIGILRSNRTATVALSLLFATGLVACGTSTSPDENRPELVPDRPAPAVRYPAVGVADRSLAPILEGYGEANAAGYADRDLVVMQMRAVLSDLGAANVERIREINPDIVILGSVQMLSIVGHWNSEWHRPRLTLGARLWDLSHDRQVRTTTGDVAMMWADMPMLNPMRDGRLDDALLNAFVDAIADHVARYPGLIDGIMHDYTSEWPWLYPSPELAGIGEVDLDQDGVGFADDPMEQEVWVAWQEQMVIRLQQRMGEGFIQIANGRMAFERPSFTRLLAGVWFEDFPTLPWHFSPRRGVEILLDVEENLLTPRRGRTWSITIPADRHSPGDVDVRRQVSLLTGTHYAYMHSDDVTHTSDPEMPDLGPATSDLVHERLPDGGVLLRRSFRDGEARIEMRPNGALVFPGAN